MNRKAMSPEAREDQLISLAIDLAEKQLREGTASSQVISHYLKLASTRDKLERELMEQKKELMAAKVEALQSERRVEELYANAIEAMKIYRGDKEPNEEL